MPRGTRAPRAYAVFLRWLAAGYHHPHPHDASGKGLALSGAEYRLLAVLLGSGNRVLSRTQLTELLRGRDADPFDRSIDVRVSRLRQILGDDARAPQIIKTVYGEGYVVGVDVVSD